MKRIYVPASLWRERHDLTCSLPSVRELPAIFASLWYRLLSLYQVRELRAVPEYRPDKSLVGECRHAILITGGAVRLPVCAASCMAPCDQQWGLTRGRQAYGGRCAGRKWR